MSFCVTALCWLNVFFYFYFVLQRTHTVGVCLNFVLVWQLYVLCCILLSIELIFLYAVVHMFLCTGFVLFWCRVYVYLHCLTVFLFFFAKMLRIFVFLRFFFFSFFFTDEMCMCCMFVLYISVECVLFVSTDQVCISVSEFLVRVYSWTFIRGHI